MAVTGKVVIITGGGKGVGRYVAETFVDAGAKVVIAEMDAVALQQAVSELKERGGDVLGVSTDVRDEAQVQAMVAQVMQTYGRIDVLINNAAIVTHSHVWPNPVWTQPWPVVRDMSFDFWRKASETTVHGQFLCSKYVIPHMEAQGGGHIITVPGGGPADKLGVLAYALAKATTSVFARYLAEEVRAANICVLAINPGATIATDDAPDEVKQAYPGVEAVSTRYVAAAEAPMELSGKAVTFKDGRIVAAG